MSYSCSLKVFPKLPLMFALATLPMVVIAQTPPPTDPDAPSPSAAVTPNQTPNPSPAQTPTQAPSTTTGASAPASSDLTAHKTKDGILFQCIAAAANTTVYLAGDFNNWADNTSGQISDSKYKMDGPGAGGVYSMTVPLDPGAHKFKYVINGSWTAADWVKERDSDDNGIIYISGAGDVLLQNPVNPAWKPATKDGKVTFQLYYPAAKSVYLAGDFNTWGNNKDGNVSDASCAMQGPDANGIWQLTVPLSPGTHAYKFAINGNSWETDPNADKLDSSGNSVIEVTK